MMRCIIIGDRPIDGSSSISSFGRAHHGPADRQHLLLTTGERSGRLAAPLRQDREQLEDPVEVDAYLCGVTAGERTEQEVFLDRHAREDPAPLRRVGQAALDDLVGGHAVDPFALERDLTGHGREQTRDGPQGGGLAGAVGADQGRRPVPARH